MKLRVITNVSYAANRNPFHGGTGTDRNIGRERADRTIATTPIGGTSSRRLQSLKLQSHPSITASLDPLEFEHLQATWNQ
jgi:hypothetical protein